MTQRKKTKKSIKNQGKANQELAYRVREHNKKTPPEKSVCCVTCFRIYLYLFWYHTFYVVSSYTSCSWFTYGRSFSSRSLLLFFSHNINRQRRRFRGVLILFEIDPFFPLCCKFLRKERTPRHQFIRPGHPAMPWVSKNEDSRSRRICFLSVDMVYYIISPKIAFSVQMANNQDIFGVATRITTFIPLIDCCCSTRW